MSIRFEERLEMPRAAAECFAFIDDFANTPRWNTRCVDIRQTSPGAREVGSTLHYRYKEPRREGEMSGVVTGYERDKLLEMKFSDPMLDVLVGFRFVAAAAGSVIEHWIEITPKTFMMKVMTPLIRSATREQLAGELAAIQRLLPAGAP